MRPIALLAAALALLVAGCGAQPQRSETRFKGDEAAVAKLVDELATAGRTGDAAKICADILAKQLVTEIKSAGGDCVTEMDRAISDASDFDLQVRDVKVNGNTATAQVRQGKAGKLATFAFVKEGGQWRASALGT